MTKIAIVCHSEGGNTKALAEAFMEGANQVSAVKAELLELVGTDVNDQGRWENAEVLKKISQADAIVFACPTYMGMVTGLFKLFADATGEFWFKQSLKDKVAGGLTTSSHPSGDKLSTLQYFAVLAAQHRMIWVGPGRHGSHLTGDDEEVDKWGFWLGVGGQGSMENDDGYPSQGDLNTARSYGQRLAEITTKLGA